jgi:molybdopterin-guanine dinucleotide biosynthesis protein A
MDVLILAGGKTDTKDPLFALSGGGNKALLSIAGKPMVQWVLDAISASTSVDTVVVIGLDEGIKIFCSKPIRFLPDKGTLIENIIQGADFLNKLHPEQAHMVTISADIPAITGEILDEMISLFIQHDVDICYSVIERPIMEKRFPGSKRTYTKFKDVEVCGGDLNYIRKSTALNPNAMWNELIRNRKNPFKQAAQIGFGTLFLILTRQAPLDIVAQRVCSRLGITGIAIRAPYAEVGMDVDKPFQFEIVEQNLLR